jgi:putative chitinase
MTVIPLGRAAGASGALPRPQFADALGRALTAAGCADRARHGALLGPLAIAAARFEIVRRERVAHWLAQLGHESADFTKMEEDLFYTDPARLRSVFPARFGTNATAEPYARNPEALANLVYSNVNGNGPIASGDGWRYRGRGLIQLTGRANYREAGRGIDQPLESEPDRAAERWTASLIAGWFWFDKALNRIADRGADGLEDVTRRINGRRMLGLADRRRRYEAARAALTPFPELLEV